MKLSSVKIYWPYAILGAFMIVVIVNITYIIAAKKTWRGVFTENSYQKGINYNETLKKIKEQEKLGISINTTITEKSYNSYLVETFVLDNFGNKLNNLSVIYKLRHSINNKADFNLIGKTNDRIISYQIFSLPEIGNWELETAISNDKFIAQDIKYITLKALANKPSNNP